jgi:hypothetical protein
MVTKITVPSSIKRALNYNEQKVREGKAECIGAHNFLQEAQRLTFYDKLHRFERLIELNERATTNTVHISLNFGPNEIIEQEKLAKIAAVYMEKIGFAKQPYLVYKHLDAGHPHIHIVTTNIQQNGKRISLHNIGRNESTKARKEIEAQYNLVKAEGQTPTEITPTTVLTGIQPVTLQTEPRPVTVQKLSYGKTPTKRAIINILDTVLLQYKFSSLHELNALLGLYNLKADRGKENGIIFRNRGLLYRVLDGKGNYIGVPIKASSIYNQPTLKFLEERFTANEQLKLSGKKQFKTKLDWILVKPPETLQGFKTALEKENISLIIRENENGLVYGLTYIDHSSKTVFNGSEIGKQYSASGILEKLTKPQQKIERQDKSVSERVEIEHSKNQQAKPTRYKQPEQTAEHSQLAQVQRQETQLALPNALERLMSPEITNDYMPFELRKSKKKKRKTK